MPDIEGTAKENQSNIYLYPRIKKTLEQITGDNGEPIEGTEE